MNTHPKLNEELLELAKYAFHKPVTGGDEAFYALLDFAKPYYDKNQQQLTSMVIDIPFDIHWKEKRLKMAGIGYVASYPEFRGNGAIRQLMTKLLHDEYEKGTALSYLAPFSYEFYAKFGYAYSFNRKKYEIPALQFPKGKKTSGNIRRFSLKDGQAQMQKIHEQAYNQGSIARNEQIWDYYFSFKSKPNFAIYEENDEKMGYLIYEFDGADFVIRELIYLTDSAKDALYRFIYSHASSFDKIIWIAPSHEKLEEDLAEPSQANIQIQPYMMARIVNLSAFLEVNGQPNFAARICDDLIPENNQTIGQGEPVEMTIGEFTARVLKEQSAILREYF
ncbi:MAG: enhanced intracellular survival protein Eis [Lactococcus sp.]